MLIPVHAWWAVERVEMPVAIVDVEPFAWVVTESIGTREAALTRACVLVPVEAFVASICGFSAQAGAVAGVPVVTIAAIVVVNALACAVASVPEVVVSAWFLKAVAAAGSHVPVEALGAFVSKAAALAVLAILVNEPVLTALALLLFALPSAVSGVPVLSFAGLVSWRAQALAASVVPEESLVAAGSGWQADATARVIVPPVVRSTACCTSWLKAHAGALILTPVEVNGAGLGSAAAPALLVVPDLVVSANLGMADAFATRSVIIVERSAGGLERSTSAFDEVPVLCDIAGASIFAQARARVSVPEKSRITALGVADALMDVEVPVFAVGAELWVGLAISRAVSVDVPEVASCAVLRFLLAAASNGVEVPGVAAPIVGAASALAGRKVPGVAGSTSIGRRSARASTFAGVPEFAFSAALSWWQADALAAVGRPVLVVIARASRLEAVALAAFIVENVVAGASLRQAAAAAAMVGIAVPELVRTAVLRSAVARAGRRVPVVGVVFALVRQDRASALLRAEVVPDTVGVLVRAWARVVFHAVPSASRAVPGVHRVFAGSRSHSGVACTSAMRDTPVRSRCARNIRLGFTFAGAGVIIIKNIIGSAFDCLHANALFREGVPRCVLAAFSGNASANANVAGCRAVRR